MENEIDSVDNANAAELRRTQIREFVTSRNIRHLVHFTQASDVSSILEHGLLSRKTLDRLRIPYRCTDRVRGDGHPEASCVSISFPNNWMLSRKRKDYPTWAPWAVMEIDVSILWELDCAFFFTNAANGCHKWRRLDELKTVKSLRDMFDERHRNRASDRSRSRPCWTPDVQAEVLVFESISPAKILSVHVQKQEQSRVFRSIWGEHMYVECQYYFEERLDYAKQPITSSLPIG